MLKQIPSEEVQPSKGRPDNRLLFISSVGCPPPFGGNRSRAKALLLEFKSLGFDIHFASVDMAEYERAATLPFVDEWVADFVPDLRFVTRAKRALGRRIRELVRGIAGRKDEYTPLDQKFFDAWLSQARKLQRERNYKYVLVSYVFHSKFLLAFEDAALRIVDTHDCFSNRREKLAKIGVSDYWVSLRPKDEARGLRRANCVIATQKHEGDYFEQLSDTPSYVVGYLVKPTPIPRPNPDALTVGYLGAGNPINVAALEWFFSKVWPLVLQQVPQAQFIVAGPISRSKLSQPSTRCLGPMEDSTPVYRDSLFMINPIQGGTGLKIKTIEALSYGRAIVTTTVGAEGLDASASVLTRDDANAFASVMVELLRNPDLAIDLGARAEQDVRKWNATNHQVLKSIFDDV